MLGSQPWPCGRRRNRKPLRNKDLQICWANTRRAQAPHIAALNLAAAEKVDVVCIQEPWTYSGSKTQSHPQYDCYPPIDTWDWEINDTEQREAVRPRVMTYVRKGGRLLTQQRRPTPSKDMLWIDVNGFAILNVYRDTDSTEGDEVYDYVTHLDPPIRCIVGGDFNVHHDMFEPGVTTAHRGAELAKWAAESGMDFIGIPGVPTHELRHVIDLTFSNVAFASSSVRTDMHCGSDHETQITVIPGRGREPLDQFHYRVPEEELGKFAGLVKNSVATLPHDLWRITEPARLNEYAIALAEVLNSAIQTVGRPDRGEGVTVPWWTDECKAAHQDHLNARLNFDPQNGTPLETREFLSIVRKAKKAYWKHRIDNIKDDKELYKIVGWHKLASAFKSPPLEVNGTVVEKTLEKAEVLRTEILERFSANDDLESDPFTDWDGTGHLLWRQSVSIEEVERYTIGISSTSPGADKVTVRLLKACWEQVKHCIHGLFSRCLALNYFLQSWKLAEVAMLPKVGKKDKTSVRSWRPIALLSCVSKGLERIIAQRLVWTALKEGILSPQHCGALPRRSAMDLIAAFTADAEAALAAKKEVTMITMDV
jgi:hypothetical protein